MESFDASHEVHVTFSTIDIAATEIDLLLKSQSSSSYSSGVIEVLYLPTSSKVQVWTYTSAQGWVQRGADISVTFANGDQFGARAKSNGQVEVYKNGSLLGSRDVTGWTYYANNGYIGVWLEGASASMLLDDFGGGTVAGGFTGGGKVLAKPALSEAEGPALRGAQAPLAAPSTPPTNHQWKVYYYAGGKPIAMRELTASDGNTLYYLHSDHLGSTSLTTSSAGAVVARQYYYPYGEIRPGGTGALPTDIGFTGQRREDAGLGSLMFYQARYMSPYLNRWLQPDPIVPEAGNPQDLNRYSYVRNNPLKYTDPTGHYVCSGQNENWGGKNCYDVINTWLDFLHAHGGDEGKKLVEQFRASDAEWTIAFEFVNLGGPWGGTNLVEKKVQIDIGVKLGKSYADLGDQSALFGHELVHLLRQDNVNNGTAWSEKEAYDVQAQLLKNMGLTPRENSYVSVIAPLAPDDYETINYYVGAPIELDAYRVIVGGLGGTIARALIVSYQAATSCYGSVCIAPGGHDAMYSPPTSQTHGPLPRRR